MPARSTPFQKLVTLLHSCLAAEAAVVESAMLPDMDTGSEREVDILISTVQSGYKLNIGIEVIEWARPADVTWVEKMSQKHKRLPTDKLVLIAKSGFTKTAIIKAKALGIEIINIEEAQELDWPLALRLIGDGIFQMFKFKFNCSLLLQGSSEWIDPTQGSLVFLPTQSQPTTPDIIATTIMHLPEAKKVIIDRVLESKERDFHAIFTQDGAEYETHGGVKTAIEKLCIEINVEFSATPFEFSKTKFQGQNFAVGQAKDPDDQLYFALTKSNDGTTEGKLYRDGELMTLNVN